MEVHWGQRMHKSAYLVVERFVVNHHGLQAWAIDALGESLDKHVAIAFHI